jgi:hypothetical protein
MALYRPKFGIGIDPLIAFIILVTELAVTNNILSAAAFRVIKKIEDRLSWQIYTMNEILGRKNNAAIALLNLQSHGDIRCV